MYTGKDLDSITFLILLNTTIILPVSRARTKEGGGGQRGKQGQRMDGERVSGGGGNFIFLPWKINVKFQKYIIWIILVGFKGIALRSKPILLFSIS